MRAYLDTNILVYLIVGDKEDLSRDIRALFADSYSLFYTSTVCVKELIHLYRTGRIGGSRSRRSELDLLEELRNLRIEIVSVTEKHLRTFSQLPFHGDHRDPDDRLIIAQAISDRIPLVSSDRKFSLYEDDGLDYIPNR